MTSMPVVLAVDAGNTKTEAAVVSLETGVVLGIGRGAIGDIYADPGPAAAAGVVRAVITDALTAASTAPSAVRHAAFRLAGVDWPEDEQFWRAVIDAEWPGLTYTLKNDGYIFTHLAHPSGHAISVVLGTGGAFAGAGPAGEFAMSWWLQHPMGASGLVAEALHAAVLAELGLAPATQLQRTLPEVTGMRSVEDVLHSTTTRKRVWTHPRLAALAPRLMCLFGVDDVFTGILTDMAEHIADYVGVVQERCGLPPDFSVAVGGGMVTGEPQFATLVVGRLTTRHPNSRIVLTSGTALDGVVASALAEAGNNVGRS